MRAELLPLKSIDDRILDQWRELARECLEPNPSFEPGMVLNAAALPDAPEVWLLLVFDSDRLHLVVPVTRARRYRRVPVPVLTTWPHDYAVLGTPLLSPAAPAAAMAAAVGLLVHDRVAPWWVLEGMSADGPVAQALHKGLQHHGVRATPFLEHVRGAVLERRSGNHLEGVASARSLKSLRRKRRQLVEALDGEVQAVDVAGADLGAAVEGFLRAEASGWKGRDGGAFLCRPGHADFFRALCRDFAAEDRLQLYTLGTPSTTVAYQCNLIAHDRVFSFKVAYVEDYRRFSAGVLLDLDVLQDFHAQDRLASIDTCTSPEDEGAVRLHPDDLAITTQLVPLTALRGRAAVRATLALATAGRRVRQWQQSRQGE